ncbi:hypothetical protein DL93DRAFT_2230773 [Clavulina sp. PMI_390]|nr:hypothetical protein DL93DRAFT_2230773 [Clavulina sp. PMI_390]
MSSKHIPPLGTTMIGHILASILWGVTTVQSTLYFSRFRRDSRWIATMVVCLWLSQCAEVVLTTRGLYRLVIVRPGASSLHGPPAIWYKWDYYSWGLQFPLASITVQTFFLYRLWTLTKYRTLNFVTTALVFGNGAFSLGTTLRVYATNGTKLIKLPLIIGYNTVSVFIDILLAGSVAWALKKHRTGFIQTDRVLNQIILYGVATGALTSLFALFILLCAALGQRAILRIATVPLGGVYIVCALAHLHSRAGLRTRLTGEFRFPTGGLSSFRMDARQQNQNLETLNTTTISSTAPSSSTYRPFPDTGKAYNLSHKQFPSADQTSSDPSLSNPLCHPTSAVQVTRTSATADILPRSTEVAADRSQATGVGLPPISSSATAGTPVLQAPSFSPIALLKQNTRPRSQLSPSHHRVAMNYKEEKLSSIQQLS